MYRNPVEMVHSFHSQLLYVGEENVPDFEQAWRLQARRAQGLDLPPRSRGGFLLQYAELGRFGSQTERVLAHFPPAQVKLILFEDFAADARRVYDEVIAFLGVPHDGRTEFARINENKRARVDWLKHFLRKPPPGLRRGVRGLKRLVRRRASRRTQVGDRPDEHRQGAAPGLVVRASGGDGGHVPGRGPATGRAAGPGPLALGTDLTRSPRPRSTFGRAVVAGTEREPRPSMVQVLKRPLRQLRGGYRRITSPFRALPSVLLIGTQKGGSTSLFNYLIQHPDVKPPLGKEVHYFDLHYASGVSWYRGRFPYRAQVGRGLTLDASPVLHAAPARPGARRAAACPR